MSLWNSLPSSWPGLHHNAASHLLMLSSVYTTRCTMQEGATVKCGGKNCTQHVHPLCARNSGGYLTTRDVGGRIVHRTFCQVVRHF